MGKRKAITPEEVIYELTLNEEFQRDIRERRVLLNIPVDGYVKEQIKDFNKFYEKVEFGAVMSEACDLTAIMFLSSAYRILIVDYLLFDKFEVSDPMDFVGRIAFPRVAGQEDSRILAYLGSGYATGMPPCVDIRFFPNITKADAVAFVEAKFDKIQELFVRQGCKPMKKHIKPKTFKERDKLILELSRKSKKELGDESAKYKDLLITNKLAEAGYIGINEGYIRKIISKYRKSKS